MAENLEHFIHKVSGFDDLSLSVKIDYFVYYLIHIVGNDSVKSKDVDNCFSELSLDKYSNSGQYLKNNSKKVKGKTPKFISKSGGYSLERTYKQTIEKSIGKTVQVPVSDNYFPLELFNNTRGYLSTISNQAAACYDHGLYDACAVMTRKLLEVLIIEAFERHKISDRIKDTNGTFYYLSDLIEKFKDESTWNIGRNAKQALPNLKKIGDMSAHNRKYTAKKSEIDKMKVDLRIVLEELLHTIDYPNWNK